ncbi:hypothetical protein LTR37_013054 [Vermiconidia calcicola]|uniref:Uncharacterized protein n=1 Tax=Vermiconidia calcicola TaxID=1690605 RepID=A0ACC3MXM4_9PEZI|nr:hypothetical protein LTR37_013054 [Vermiconidia calcicola]
MLSIRHARKSSIKAKEAGSGRPQTNNNTEDISFWNVNLPSQLHTKVCPDFLRYALTNDKDRRILSTPDSHYHRQSWQEVQRLIHRNRIDLLQRLPSDLRRYREYCEKLMEEYGTIMNFVMQERLQWQDLTPTSEPFSDPDDLKILYNDWPYGVDERIVHLVVWTKFEIPAAPISSSNPFGDLTPEAREQVNDFVDRTFVSVCGRENVIWFRNWSSLKSIHAVEHFHVMLFDPDMNFVRRITCADVPLAQKRAIGYLSFGFMAATR